MSLLSVHVDELEAMRSKLLSAVFTGSIVGAEAEHACHAAEHLKRLALLVESSGTTFITTRPQSIGDLLEDAIRSINNSPSVN